MMLHLKKSLGLAAFLSLSACHGDDPFGDANIYSSAVASVSSLVWIDHTEDELLFMTPQGDEMTWSRAGTGAEDTTPEWMQPTVDRTRLLVLLGPGADTVDNVIPQLAVHPSDGSQPPAHLDLPAAYTRVSQSPDGRWAVLHFSSADPPSNGGLQNANLVTIVDLQTLASRTVTLNGFGGRLLQVQYPIPTDPTLPATVQVGAQARDLVAFLSDSEIVLIDASDSAASQVGVRFAQDITFNPEETLLRPGNALYPNPALFLRSSLASDVAMLTLVDNPDPQTGRSGFSAQVSLIPVGQSASDFAALDQDDVPYLVTLDPDRSAVVFTDIRTQQGFGIALGQRAERFFLRQQATDTGVQPQMVAWSQSRGEGSSAGGTAIHTLALDNIEKTAGQRPRSIQLQDTIQDLVPLSNDRVLVGTAAALYVIDFPNDQVTPLSTPTMFDPRSSIIYGDTLFLGPRGQQHVSTVNLSTLSPTSIRLDASIDAFFYLPQPQKAVVLHPDPAGHLTILDPASPSRATSRSQWGFFHQGFLERGER